MRLRAAFPTVTATAAAILYGALLLPAALPHSAAAQTKLTNVVPPSVAVTIRAKITAMDVGKREVTLTGASGTPVTLTVGPAVRLEMLKVGDTVDAQYYRSVAFMVSPPGTAVPDDEIEQAVARPVEAPGGVGMRVTRISGLVVGIDLGTNSLEWSTPRAAGSIAFK